MVPEQGQALEGNTLLSPELSWSLVPCGQCKSLQRGRITTALRGGTIAGLQGLPGCFPSMQSEKILPQYHNKLVCSTVIWGLEIHFGPQFTFTWRIPSNTNIGKRDGRQHTRLSAFADGIPTETKPLFLKEQSWGYFSFTYSSTLNLRSCSFAGSCLETPSVLPKLYKTTLPHKCTRFWCGPNQMFNITSYKGL